MDLLDLKKHLADICHRASERWLTSGSGGNISVRIPNTDRYLCTATGVTFRDTAVENVVEMDLAGNQVGGFDFKPSKEYRWHAASSRPVPTSTASSTPTRPPPWRSASAGSHRRT